MKKFTKLCLAATAAVVGLTPAFTANAQEKPKIYVIAPDSRDPFWITQRNGAEQAGKDFDVNVIVAAPESQSSGDTCRPFCDRTSALSPSDVSMKRRVPRNISTTGISTRSRII